MEHNTGRRYWGWQGQDKEGREWTLTTVLNQDTIDHLKTVDGVPADLIERHEHYLEHGMGTCINCGQELIDACEEGEEESGWVTDDGQALCHNCIAYRNRQYVGLIDAERDGKVTVYDAPYAKIEELRAEQRAKQEKRRKWHEDLAADGTKECCDRCGGYGIISAYKHVNGGTCFKCGGQGWVPTK